MSGVEWLGLALIVVPIGLMLVAAFAYDVEATFFALGFLVVAAIVTTPIVYGLTLLGGGAR